MTQINLVVNGCRRHAEVEPRTHLADFLRDALLLSGTHLGCEHGVCGACTLLVDGQPVRSCLTFAAQCDGAEVRSIEGLAEDAVMAALRAAFTAEHALQCGYCTPGMLVTARDIVLRLPHADDDRIRLELAGNLCRCTGYNGIVKAIRRVLDAQFVTPFPALDPAGEAPLITASVAAAMTSVSAPLAMPKGSIIRQSVRIAMAQGIVWTAIQDPAFVARCVPGVRLTRVDGETIDGEMRASLGPIQARFAGTAQLVFDAGQRSGHLIGEGRDALTGTRLTADVRFTLQADGAEATEIDLEIGYALRGALAQFSRGAIVQVLAADIAATAAANLQARLLGAEPSAEQAPLGAGQMLLRVLWRTLLGLLKKVYE